MKYFIQLQAFYDQIKYFLKQYLFPTKKHEHAENY